MARHGLSRRHLLRLAALVPLGAIVAACGSDDETGEQAPSVGSASIDVQPAGNARSSESTPTTIAPTLIPTATPEPFILPAGEDRVMLMPDTPYESPLYVYGTGRLGPIITALGGVHGNEPGGWLAAERLVEQVRPEAGGLLVLPRANRQAVDLFVRTTDDLGDLNRMYPGDPNGLPMARMAYEIVEALRRFHVTHVIDMHESWAFFRDRTETATGTAYLGQTLSSRGEAGEALGQTLVEIVNNTHVRASHEEFTFREWPPRGFTLPAATPGPSTAAVPEPGTTGPQPAFGGSRSSLGLPNVIPGLSAILVEMGQQQDLERRVQLHVDVVREALRILAT